MKDSEFISKDNLTLNVKDGKPSPNIDGAKEIKIKKGDKIPEIFIPLFIRYNRDYIDNLKIVDGIPQLTKEQEKKYEIVFSKPEPKTFRQVIDKEIGKYTEESLNQKISKLGKTKFKEWAEKTFGEDNIDRRKAASNIVIDILNMQVEGKI